MFHIVAIYPRCVRNSFKKKSPTKNSAALCLATRKKVLALSGNKKLKVGIGFATGRKNFQDVLSTDIYNWKESGLVDNADVSLNIFVAYDLTYNETKSEDYTDIQQKLKDQLDDIVFIDKNNMTKEINRLVHEGVIKTNEAIKIFEKGYAGQRNAILYYALKNNIDYLIFLDDDEYPLTVADTKRTALWGGQEILSTHLEYISQADVTHGHHCGYVSPIPNIEFDETLNKDDFRLFIEAISNDIINWSSVERVMKNGGVTYADTTILLNDVAYEVPEINHAKFISGSNLCINLTDAKRALPFYNPPGARGEDAFLSTLLTDRTVLSIPCYTFHDGFSTYHHLLEGVLPTKLKFISSDDEKNVKRFYDACIGWVRYKPLFLYITQPEEYEKLIDDMRVRLESTIPSICEFFSEPAFENILVELDKYHKNVKKHYREFIETQALWKKVVNQFAKPLRESKSSTPDQHHNDSPAVHVTDLDYSLPVQ